jgi:diguanylate cyclase (GGDEF)-like protein
MQRPRPILWLVVCGVTLIAAIAFGTATMVFHFRDRALRNSERELSNTALLLSQYINRELEELELVQDNLIEDIRSSGIDSPHEYRHRMSGHDVHLILKERISGFPHVGGIGLVDSDGRLINASRAWPAPDADFADRDYFLALKANPSSESYTSEPLRNRGNGAWTIVVARRLTSASGEFLGIVFGGIELTQFERYFRAIALGEGSSISFFRNDGVLIVRHPSIESAIGKKFLGFVDALGDANAGTTRMVGKMDGLDRLLAAHRLAKFPLVVVAGLEVSAALADWREQTKLLIGVGGLCAVIIAVILFLIVRQISQAHEWSRQRLLLEKQRLDTAMANMPHGVCMFGPDKRLVIANDLYSTMYGLSPDQTKPGTTLAAILEARVAVGSSPRNADRYVAERLQEAFLPEPGYIVNELRDGRVIAISRRPMPDGGSVAIHQDITAQKRADERIAYLAHYDALTDLPNRFQFREQLEQRLRFVQRGECLAVLYFDLDHFKSVNDTLGHPVGDELLKAMADRLRGCVRETDLVARLGGDEFAIIQHAAALREDVIGLADRIQQAIKKPFEFDGHQIVADTSIGIAMAPADGTEPNQLLKNADLALYEAKTAGRGTYRFFESSMDARIKARRALEFDLRQAIMCEGFELHYQPLVDFRDNRITGCEALLRWPHPDRGMISPAEFIPVAEETGLINQLGDWVLKTACLEASSWPGDMKIAVNVSPVQFKSRTLALAVASALAASRLPAHRLELEITEAVLIDDDETVLPVLHQLRNLGVRIAMDDFGTGYSSLSYLQRFPFDKIKIDRRFINGVAEQDGSLAIVQAVIGIARSRNIATTAEGVETDRQRDLLRALGCTEMQGHLFSPAKSAAEIWRLFSPSRERAAGAA